MSDPTDTRGGDGEASNRSQPELSRMLRLTDEEIRSVVNEARELSVGDDVVETHSEQLVSWSDPILHSHLFTAGVDHAVEFGDTRTVHLSEGVEFECHGDGWVEFEITADSDGVTEVTANAWIHGS